MNNDAIDRMRKIRTSLILTNPFFGSLAMRLKLVEAQYLPQAVMTGPQGQTAVLLRKLSCATDGKHFFYNPEFLATLSDLELKGVFCHEILHCALGHPWRLGDRDKLRANHAMDYAINPVVKEAGMTLPSDCLYDKKFEGLPWEQIYVMLQENPTQQLKQEMAMMQAFGDGGDGEGDGEGQEGDQDGNGKGKGKNKDGKGNQKQPGGSGGSGKDEFDRWGGVVGQDPKEDDGKQQESDWKVATVQAATAAKQQGTLPAGLQRFVDELVRNKVDWKSVLRRFVQQHAKADYSWRMPSSRYAAQNLYLPKIYSETMPPIVVGIDTSGSIGGEELNVFHSELTAIIEECKPEKTFLVYCDAEVSNVQEFYPGDPLDFHPSGGGGTDMPKILEWNEKEGIEPACVIILTDGYTGFGEPRDYPVLWAITTKDIEAPWGESLYLGDDL